MDKQSDHVVRKSHKQIQALKKQTAGFNEQLNIDGKASYQSNTALASQIANLQRFGDSYARKIQKQQKKLKELDDKIQDVQQRINLQRIELKRNQQNKDSNEELSRKIKNLQNKLDKQLQKYNQAIGQNKSLREQIDSLRRERVVFDNIYKKLQTQLNEKKKTMVKIIEQAQTAYHQREQAKTQLLELKRNSEQEQKQFDTEWRKLNQLIEKDKQKKQFIKADQDRQLKNLQNSAMMGMSSPRNNQDTKSRQYQMRNHLDLEEKNIKSKISSTSWNLAKDSASIQATMAKVQQYEQAFKSIKQATNLSSLDDIVELFVKAEQQNFSLFNYVNELTAQMESLQSQITQTKIEIDKYQHSGYIGRGDEQQIKMHQQLEQRMKAAQKEKNDYEEQFNDTMKTMNQLKNGVQSIFEKIGCSNQSHPQIEGVGVNECNMATYLGIIQKRAMEIVQVYQTLTQQNKTADKYISSLHDDSSSVSNPKAIQAQQQSQPSQQQSFNVKKTTSVDPPDISTFYSEDRGKSDDDEGIPLTEKDLKEKALKFFNKRNSAGASINLQALDEFGKLNKPK